MIPSRLVFDNYAGDYDRWFDDHGDTYAAQVRLLRDAVPQAGRGFELGVGSGRFAIPLTIRYGIDPSIKLLGMAYARGVEVVLGEGEHLPFRKDSLDFVLMMTTVCFLEYPAEVLRETHRVLVKGGDLIVGFIEKDGEIAVRYLQEKTKGRFLQYARFMAIDEVTLLFHDAGFFGVSVIRRSGGFCIMRGHKAK